MLAAAGAVTQGVCGDIGGALGVCGWRLGVCARVLSVLVSKLGPVWVGRLRVSAHAGWAGRWCGWCACVPLVGRIVVAWLSLVFVSAPLLFCQCGGMVDTPASKAGARLGVRVRVSRLVLGEAKRFNTSARVRVLWGGESQAAPE